jgi:hypothetical protein
LISVRHAGLTYFRQILYVATVETAHWIWLEKIHSHALADAIRPMPWNKSKRLFAMVFNNIKSTKLAYGVASTGARGVAGLDRLATETRQIEIEIQASA